MKEQLEHEFSVIIEWPEEECEGYEYDGEYYMWDEGNDYKEDYFIDD
jgi:hypothetical protein